MDRISEQQRAAINKTSDARLRAKLVQAGFQARDVEVLERPKLIEMMIALTAEENESVTGAEAAATRTYFEETEDVDDAKGTVVAGMSLEERQLMLREREMEERRQHRLLEERRLEQEKVLKEKELLLKEKEMEFEREKSRRETEWKENPANKLKLWGDALRNTISRMPVESIDIVSWFQSLEHLFQQLRVPYELQAVLVRPYLSDKAKSLLSRVDLDKSTDYCAIKKYLLQEMQLSPSVYLDKFQSVCRSSAETYHQFANKLSSLFEYYVESRKVGNNYDKLMELIVYDRIKASLPPFLSRHVLALESSSTLLDKGGWLGKNALVEALDAYTAGLTQFSGSNKTAGASGSSGVKPYSRSPKFIPRMPQKPQFRGEPPQAGQKSEVSNFGSTAVTPRWTPARRCFLCNSSGHLVVNCPKRTTGAKQDKTGNSAPHASVHACTVDSVSTVAANAEAQPITDRKCEPSCDSNVTDGMYDAALAVDSEHASLSSNACQLPKNESINITDDSIGHLSFCDVEIKGLPSCVRALDDSGTQMSLVNPKVIETLDLPRFGKVVVRGALGNSICAPLVNLQLRLPDAINYTNVTCVVCEGLNLDLILVADIVTKLNLAKSEFGSVPSFEECEQDVIVDVSNTTVNDTVDDNMMNDQHSVSSDQNDADVLNADDVNDMNDDDSDVATPSIRTASSEQLIKEQREDRSLANCWSLAQRDKAGYFVRNGILYRKEKIMGQEFEQLCLPRSRRAEAIKLAHQVGGGHLAAKKTKERLKLSFTWPMIAADVKHACQVCDECQKRRRVTVYDRIPIAPVPCNENVFDCWVMDCLGPLFPNQKVKYNYCLVLCDRVSRFPVAFCLPSLSAKCVCNALLQLFQMTGIPSVIQSDCGTNFTSKLTRTFLQMLGCSPRFNVPGRPQQSGLVERLIGTLKNMISKVAADHPKSSTTYLGYVLWALREVPNETTGVPPWMIVTF